MRSGALREEEAPLGYKTMTNLFEVPPELAYNTVLMLIIATMTNLTNWTTGR